MRAQIAERKAEILALLRRQSSTNRIAVPPIRRRAHGEPAPLSFAQERLWFLEQLQPESAAYNICRASRLLGNLSSPALEASLNEIVSRHETLRTAFRLIDGKPVQVVRPAEGLSIDFVDLCSVQESERAANIQRQIEAEALRPFNLDSGLLLRCALLRVGEQEHILVLTIHHSAADAWSMGILTRELWTLHDAFSNGRPCPLEPLPVQYSDYAVWQREWLQGDVLESQLGYWKERLKDLSVLNLPADRPRKPRQSFHGARLTIELPDELTSAVKEMSHRFAVTPFMILLAAFQVLLSRYTGQEDVVVGSPIAHRARTEFEPLIGFFVNTLVLRSDLSGSPGFRELLMRVREVCLGAYAHQDLPFEQLVQELQRERDLSRNPLFQVMFVLQNATAPFTGIPGIRVEPIIIENPRSPFDLSLFLREREGKYIGYIEYSTDLFNRDRIERMSGQFQTLLEATVADPDQSIATLPILTDAERHKILIQWNDTVADYPKDKCIHQLFEEQVERTPEAIAVTFEDQRITYRELNQRANQLAQYLISLGISPEKLVGICVERSIEMVVGLLGILKAGGAYVPLDPAYPEERLRFMLQDSQVSVLLTTEKLIEEREWTIEDGDARFSILKPPLKLVHLDRDLRIIEQQISENPTTQVDSHARAYVIYTSGSTGTPKGVVVSHQPVVNHIYWAQSKFPLSLADSVVQKTTLNFDASVWEIFAPLLNGARLVLAKPGAQQDIEYLVRILTDQKISVLKLVPSLLEMLLETNLENCKDLRHVLCGGETLTVDLHRTFAKRSSASLHNLYGPTEGTIDATCWSSRIQANTFSVPIGGPIDNVLLYILDRNLQLVPIGVPGELHIGGDCLADGYLNRPNLTAERFISNPFPERRSPRLYRTGDVVRYFSDGKIEFLRRLDNQIKLRGNRIELGEIEATLRQHSNVKDCVVDVRLGASQIENTLVAYVVSMQGTGITITELREFLAQKLPIYMIPPVILLVEALPLLPNGKIDRHKLASSTDASLSLVDHAVSPHTSIQEIVAQVWQQELQIEGLRIHDNFFALGGHSLLAVHLTSRLQKLFNKPIPLQFIFESPTIAGVANKIEKLLRDEQVVHIPPIVSVGRHQPLPLTLNQEQLWKLNQIIPGTSLFSIPHVYHISGDLNVDVFKKSIAELVRRHETLRTSFRVVNGDPVQVISQTKLFDLSLIDLRCCDDDERAERTAELILEERQKPFNLESGALFRASLLRLTDTDFVFMMTLHHIIGDQWSTQVLRRELLTLYAAFKQGRPSPLKEGIVQFADYACWERTLLEGNYFSKQLEYWKHELGISASLPKSTIVSSSPPAMTFQTARQSIALDETLFANIQSLARKENCTPYVVLLTALNILLHELTSDREIRIGTLLANRSRGDVAETVGYFTNTVVICCRMTPSMTAREILEQVRGTTINALVHQELPFEYLAQQLQAKFNIRRYDIFRAMLIYQKSYPDAVDVAGLSFASLQLGAIANDAEVTITACDFVFNFRESSTKLTGVLTFKTEVISRHQAFALVAQLETVLDTMITDPNRKIRKLHFARAD